MLDKTTHRLPETFRTEPAHSFGGGQIRSIQCILQGICKRVFVERIDEAPKDTLSQRIDTAITISGDDLKSAGGRLQEHDAKPFADAWHDEHVGQAKLIHQLFLRNLTRKNNMFGYSVASGQFFEARTVVTISGNQVARLRMFGE